MKREGQNINKIKNSSKNMGDLLLHVKLTENANTATIKMNVTLITTKKRNRK